MIGIGGLALCAVVLAVSLPGPENVVESKLIAAKVDARTAPVSAERRQRRALAPDPSFVLDGAFYQPDLSAGFADRELRKADLARLVRLGGTTVWLQYLAHGEYSLLEPFPERVDPIRGLLDDAHDLGLAVWLGTREDPRLWSEQQVPLSLWKEVGDRALLIAEEAAARYGDHPAFAGWYWTPEVVWSKPPGPERTRRLANITARQVSQLRTLVPGAPVAVVLGPGGSLGREFPTRGWCRFLTRVAPEVVVVMDGVGTGHVDISQLDLLYAAAVGCAKKAGASVVADVEVFGTQYPPDPGRLRAQFAAGWKRSAAVVAFDLPHHMKEGSVAVRLASGELTVGPEMPGAESRDPSGDWLAVPPSLATLDVVPESPGPVGSAELVTRSPHPAEVSLSLDDGSGLLAQGSLEPHEGPGRDEITWRWRGSGGPVSVGARFTVRRGDGQIDVLAARLRGP